MSPIHQPVPGWNNITATFPGSVSLYALCWTGPCSECDLLIFRSLERGCEGAHYPGAHKPHQVLARKCGRESVDELQFVLQQITSRVALGLKKALIE